MDCSRTVNAREAAYLALLASRREECFVSDFLEKWRKDYSPSPIDTHLAREIAFGTTRMTLALDYIATQLSDKKTLKLKRKERSLLHTALYQHVFMDRIPLYAIVDETLKIAKKHCHHIFTNYLNATLRQLEKNTPTLPQGDSIEELSIRYSYPVFFVQAILDNYGLDQAKQIFALGNTRSITMARNRRTSTIVTVTENVAEIASSQDYYIQNATPATLISTLAANNPRPKRVLDLCASPGGKLLSAHDAFPEAELYANDISQKKVDRLSENCDKYNLNVHLSCSPGELLTSDQLFDLIILDVPCSNTGVLNKRPEARWRLSEQAIEALQKTQTQLLEHAATLVSPGGEIWYITCSILKEENEYFIEKMCNQLNLSVRTQKTQLPTTSGWDGGFGCALSR